MPNPAKKKQKPLWLFFVIGLLMISLFWGINFWLLKSVPVDADPEEAERSVVRIKNLAELQVENQAKLETYAWVDRAKGSVQIPVSEAIRIVIPELNSKSPRAAYPIVVPVTASPSTPSPTP